MAAVVASGHKAYQFTAGRRMDGVSSLCLLLCLINQLRYPETDAVILRASPIPDPATQRKATNSRDPNNPHESTPRRPSLFETRHVSRNSNSGNNYPTSSSHTMLNDPVSIVLFSWIENSGTLLMHDVVDRS